MVGRILYEYEQGGWNEWHIVFNDGASGWLSDAQLEYDVSFLSRRPARCRPASRLRGARQFQWNGAEYEVTSVTRAHYKGVAGRAAVRVLGQDGRRSSPICAPPTARFGTIDYSDDPPLLFLGEAVEFDDLHLKNLREFEGWR